MATKQTNIVKQAEIVPQLDQSSLRTALHEVQDDLAVVPEWMARAQALTVTNAEEYKAAGEFRAEVRSQRKQPKFRLESFQEVAKRVTDFLKMRRSEAEAQFDAIDNIITVKMNQQAERERLAAEAEQRRINDEKRKREEAEAAERRKAADAQAEADRKQREKQIAEAKRLGEVGKREAERMKKAAEEQAARDREAAAKEEAEAKANFKPVEVKPNLPTIAGSRRHRNFFAEFTDFPVLLEAWRQARNKGDMERAAFLRRFITGDEKELNKEARDTRDSKVMENAIPGIHAFDKDVT